MNHFENQVAQDRAEEPLYLDAECRELPDGLPLRYKFEIVALFAAMVVGAIVFSK